jgi:tetratricopeptide (TPR) repeat protein
MTSASEKVEQVFWDALQLGSEEKRSAYLDNACGGDEELRSLVEKLLRAQPKAAAFLEQPFTEPGAATAEPIHEGPGMLIGPYKLLEQIGEGGFGVVFMAEQTAPVRRRVALKILKPGMDTRQVIARFEAERQALAIMDHPNIAKVHDGGVTPLGRPYFVMELVKGVSITEFCVQALIGARLSAGRTADAIALSEHAGKVCVKKLGADHPITLATLHNQAQTYRAAGKTAAALALYQEVRDACVKKLGADHPQTLATLAGLAIAYEAAGKPEQALPLLQRASVAIEKRQFVDPHAGQIIGALTGCHERLKQYDLAESWRRKWLAVVKQRSGADSLPYATETALLGRNLLKQKKYAESEPIVRECLAIREKKQPDEWTTFNAQSMLGEALYGQQKHAAAESLLVKGYEGMKKLEPKLPGSGYPNLIESFGTPGRVL